MKIGAFVNRFRITLSVILFGPFLLPIQLYWTLEDASNLFADAKMLVTFLFYSSILVFAGAVFFLEWFLNERQRKHLLIGVMFLAVSLAPFVLFNALVGKTHISRLLSEVELSHACQSGQPLSIRMVNGETMIAFKRSNGRPKF